MIFNTLEILLREATCTIPIYFYTLAKSCEFTSGDTTGGPEYQVDKADTAEGCAKNVRLSTYSHKATGATWNPKSKKCWAETGNSITASPDYRTCHFLSKFI